MNIKIENNKQLIFFLASVGLVVVSLSIFILFAFSNNEKYVVNNNSSSSSIVSRNSSSIGPEQIPERITDFYSALPFYSEEFNVEYDKVNNQLVVSSTKYEVDKLTPIFKNWLSRFPNLRSNSIKIKYIGSSEFIIDKITDK